MFKQALILSAILLAPSAQAVELRNATNQQLIDELSHRLSSDGGGGGNQGFSTTVVCDHADLEVSIYDVNFQRIAFLEDYVGSTDRCRELLDVLNLKASNRVKAGQQLAFCDHADLEIYGVLPDGKLQKVSDVYKGSPDACWTAATAYNRQ